MDKKFVFSVSALIGMIVGGGIFGLPYVVSVAGLIPAIFYFVVLSGAVLLTHLLYGEIILRTKERYRLAGFAEKYLGKIWKNITAVAVIFGGVGVLLVYIIIAGDFLKIIVSPIGDFSSFVLGLFFGVFLTFFIIRGIKFIAPAEFVTNLLFLAIVIIFFFALPRFDFSNLAILESTNIFLPYGVILFSLIGWAAIPELREISGRANGFEMKKILIVSAIIVSFIYILFSLSVVGVSGENTSMDALSGLIPFLGPNIVFFGALAGLLTIADSFLISSFALINTLVADFRISKRSAILISCGLPLVLFLFGLRSFISIIGFMGTIIGATEGLAIVLIYKKIKEMGNRKPEYSLNVPLPALYLLMAVFLLGAISQIIYFLK
ncbi:MAG: hypothetical protein COZ91_00400 [Candidatus Nealsonbacteria bacterium CG_4_8_14_3_um_filter_39_7]|uniref:Amino acid transporter transmembrane domain-containing protein n=1 Tax=Candidatus Nealsonbacteria bacterium CG23_combo_of_CG06-09_8_20_14_all_39_17 TaxID=1974722 RepID=A0A2G9YUM9_9BACT|nr:MAG: hypothetical protein COX37_01230 [Candidatus Nealsonbacteria bacterium CG23_combo_of_CG06-09_8_20_14_all_39_17]PIU43798.1 MAG: hypothetical protein COS96_02470 [Candidatus Nealsonbacteria bacterium CG07_land_8_20_14_0_80_39_13]PIW91715.1 MAG: hypothetical protein COZ91_00400 [Candidatus Nealsonbacteria bacterium CG_4_8_14_3_um_filter_39_7]